MPQDNQPQVQSASKSDMYQYAQSPLFKGPLMGSVVTFLVSPGINWTNHKMNDNPLNWGNPFSITAWRKAYSGSLGNAFSAIPQYIMAFSVKRILQPKEEQKTSFTRECATSFAAGATAGVVGTPFDCIVQNKQLSSQKTGAPPPQAKAVSPSYASIFQQITKANGLSAVTRGSIVTGFREGSWSLVYLTAVKTFSHQLEKQHQVPADTAILMASVACAGTYGVISTPVNQLRSRKQSGLVQTCANKSYAEHAKDIWNQKPNASAWQRLSFIFKGAAPRAITTTAAGAAIVKGGEMYDQLINPKM